MLEPQDRAVLLAALRPPDGFVVDRALATTFTLDLTALLTAPLAFSMYDGLLASDKGKAGGAAVETLDPYALLKAVRGHAERLTVFCQATRIAPPAKYRRLLGYLESCVVQVQARKEDGIFHPKLWILRFTRNLDDEVRYRVLCLSRNLTFDRSWDTLLSLDGEYARRTNAFAENHPLGDFITALPELAIAPMDATKRQSILEVADEIRRVKFELPDAVESIRFHPLGIEGHQRSPFDKGIERFLIVSPFVSEAALKQLSQAGRKDVLVSRIDQLEAIPAAVLAAYSELHVLDAAAEFEEHESSDPSMPVASVDSVASGLHAKLYVADHGSNAHIWTGSANATTAAFERNVEFLVQLTGKRKALGVDATLDGRGGKGGLRALLASFTPPSEPVQPTAASRRLEQRLHALRMQMARSRWVAVVGEEQASRFPFALEVQGEPFDLPEDVVVKVWPITLPRERAQQLRPPLERRVSDFGPCSFDALTSFFAFAVQLSEGEEELEDTFVLNVVLEGAPANRAGRILQSLLDDPAKVLQFLRILLATDPLEALEVMEQEDTTAQAVGAPAGVSDSALLETLLRALDRDPGRIDAVSEIVRDLSSTEAGRRAFPAGFMNVWEPIRNARATRLARGPV
jgi:hypothetical protein